MCNMYLKEKQKVKTRMGHEGVIQALDWVDGKIVSAGVDIMIEGRKETIHVRAEDIV